jgi:3-oxoacyl-[acyl-carrier protein] reductase
MKRALVTGGSGGIGAATCRRLARAGHFVYVHAHRGVEAATATVEDIRADGGHAAVLQFDVTDAAAAAAAIDSALSDGAIQVLINNAGIHDDAVFAGMNARRWHSVIDVSLHGFYNVTQPLILSMIRSRWGRVVNVSSVSAIAGNRGQVNYAAAKGALISAGKALSLEVASRGITVNSVAPGIIETAMSATAFTPEAIAALVPMKRVGLPDEVAHLIAFLASDEAGYITGQTISINGGMI